MKESESSNASSSGATSTDEPNKKLAKLSEVDFLKGEATDAAGAMGAAWSDLKQSLGSTVDMRKWTGRYPWIAAGTALAAGLAAGYILTPRDKDEAAQLWEKLKAKVVGEKADPNTVYVEPVDGKAQQPVPEKPTLLGTILREASKTLIPMVTSMIGAAVGGGEGAAVAEKHAQAGDGSSQH